MSELNKCLKCLYEHYAVVFPPVDPKTVQQASVTLVKAGVPPIPLDYVSFLGATNGLFWNGITLFALNNIERNKGAFTHPGILQHYAFCQNNAVMKKTLLLGYGWETLITYDFATKEYRLLDRFTYQSLFVFQTFVKFLQYITRHLQAQATPTTP